MTPVKMTMRERFASMDMKPFTHYHDDKGKQWLVVDCEDSLICMFPDNILILPEEDPVAESWAKKVAEFLCEDFFNACEKSTEFQEVLSL